MSILSISDMDQKHPTNPMSILDSMYTIYKSHLRTQLKNQLKTYNGLANTLIFFNQTSVPIESIDPEIDMRFVYGINTKVTGLDKIQKSVKQYIVGSVEPIDCPIGMMKVILMRGNVIICKRNGIVLPTQAIDYVQNNSNHIIEKIIWLNESQSYDPQTDNHNIINQTLCMIDQIIPEKRYDYLSTIEYLCNQIYENLLIDLQLIGQKNFSATQIIQSNQNLLQEIHELAKSPKNLIKSSIIEKYPDLYDPIQRVINHANDRNNINLIRAIHMIIRNSSEQKSEFAQNLRLLLMCSMIRVMGIPCRLVKFSKTRLFIEIWINRPDYIFPYISWIRQNGLVEKFEQTSELKFYNLYQSDFPNEQKLQSLERFIDDNFEKPANLLKLNIELSKYQNYSWHICSTDVNHHITFVPIDLINNNKIPMSMDRIINSHVVVNKKKEIALMNMMIGNVLELIEPKLIDLTNGDRFFKEMFFSDNADVGIICWTQIQIEHLITIYREIVRNPIIVRLFNGMSNDMIQTYSKIIDNVDQSSHHHNIAFHLGKFLRNNYNCSTDTIRLKKAKKTINMMNEVQKIEVQKIEVQKIDNQSKPLNQSKSQYVSNKSDHILELIDRNINYLLTIYGVERDLILDQINGLKIYGIINNDMKKDIIDTVYKQSTTSLTNNQDCVDMLIDMISDVITIDSNDNLISLIGLSTDYSDTVMMARGVSEQSVNHLYTEPSKLIETKRITIKPCEKIIIG